MIMKSVSVFVRAFGLRCDMKWLFVFSFLAAGYYAAATDLKTVGNVRNLNVSLISFNNDQRLKFNVSWLPPDSSASKQPSFYSVIVTSIVSNDSNNGVICNEESIYHVVESIDQTNVLLPENRFVDEAVDELDVEPGCSYKIQVFSNPRSSHDTEDSPSIVYKVPECIGIRCNCAKSSETQLPIPTVTAKFFTNGSILINWKVDPSTLVKSYKISIGVPNLTSSSGLIVYNKTKIFTTKANSSNYDEELSYLWEPLERPKRGTKIFVSARDSYGCSGAEGTYMTKRPRHTSFYRKNATAIAFGVLVLTCGLLWSLVSFVKYLVKSHHDYKLVSLGRKSSCNLTSVLSNPKIEALLKNHNSLYVEQQNIENVKSTDPLEIKYTRLREVRQLGSGQFGRVYLADLLGDFGGRQLVAVKTSLDSQLEVVRQQLLEEIAIIKLAGSHPHLVSLLGYSTAPDNPVCLVLEYMRGGELLSYLHRMRDAADSSRHTNNSNNNHDSTYSLESPGIDSIAETTCTSLSSQSTTTMTTRRVFFDNDIKSEDLTSNSEEPISQTEMMRFALEIARGMEHLEAKGIVHRDLAARNVLMDENLVLKICDFGLSRKGDYMLNGAGVRRLPIRWMPPEAIRRRAFTNKSDVWSYGLCLWEIATLGDFPYSRLDDDNLVQHLLEENVRPDIAQLNETSTVEMKELMEMCWAKLPECRPNFKQIVVWLESKRDCRSKSNPMYHDVDVLKV